jgi:8-oxo-dGTP pyrophosphatase MutT (NUDIX family)
MAKDVLKNFLNIMAIEINDFYGFMEKLGNRLNQPLPGNIAHNKMVAKSRPALNSVPNEFTKSSAVLILFYPSAQNINIPLILRPKYDGMHGGQVAFPGGRVEKTDENLIRTALREAQEEIGIRISDVTIIGQLTELFIPPSNYMVQPVVGFLNAKPAFYPDPKEVDLVFEVSLQELADPNIITTEILDVRGVEIEAPLYSIMGNTIWGATAMMIAELLMIINELKEIN